MNILLVEDDAVTRSFLGALLKKRGHHVFAFEDAETAWETACRTDLPLAVIDWHLPGRSGLELCRQIRKVRGPNDPVILIMSHSRELDDVKSMLDAGADDYLPKPLDASQLEVRLTVAAFQATQRQTYYEELRLLNQVLHALNETDGDTSALEKAIRTICEGTGWIVGEIYNVDTASERLVRSAVWYNRRHHPPTPEGQALQALCEGPMSFARGEGIVGECWSSGAQVWVREDEIERYPRVQLARRAGIGGMLAVPVQENEVVNGVLCFMMEVCRPQDDRWVEMLKVITHELQSRVRRQQAEMEQQRSAEALRSSEEQLRLAQKMEAIGRLAGGVAHDFNNLLTAILGYSDLLLYRMDAAHPWREELEEIKAAGERAAGLTNQLLVFSRKQLVLPVVLRINDVVRNLERLLTRIIGEDIELETELASNLPSLLADRGQLEQVVMNLAVNARDAMPSGGRLHISTRRDAEGGILLRVRDSGIGMDAETVTRIFEPFFTTKDIGKGTGLGLSTVYAIIEGLGGYIRVDTAPGRGTAFDIHLPGADQVEGSHAVHAPAVPPARLEGTRILIVEDEEVVRLLIRRTLSAYGALVLEATDGHSAIQTLESVETPVDLVISDVVMPGMSGRALLEEMDRRGLRSRLLFTSGYTSLEAHDVSHFEHPFLQKPFTPLTLIAKVRDVLAGRAMATE